MTYKHVFSFILVLSVIASRGLAYAETKPNILLIMVDDLGFADFGCYGSEIETPTIDALASKGLRFSQFYNTGKCATSRVCLLSGLYRDQCGSGFSRGTTIPTVLADAGYFTSMTGKWHLGKQPTDFGFMRYWGHLSGATDFFIGDDTFRMNGEKWDDFGEDFYTTDANVDYSIQFLDEAIESGKPFFHYVAFNAPHYPLQAPEEDIRKYAGRYDGGWEDIRRARFEKQKAIGLFPEATSLPPMPEHVPNWDSLTEKERAFESFRMAVYAAMVDRLDRNIGRLMAHLEQRGVAENTLFMLCSDNGGCPFERSSNLTIPPWKGESHYCYDASWATVSNTPLRHYKQTQHEGGVSSPLIVHWPKKIRDTGAWVNQSGHLIDIMATCIEAAGATYPTGDRIEPLAGKSLVPYFKGLPREPHEEIYFRFSSCRALRQGNWKAVSFYGSRWELYNIEEDRFEQNDLSAQFPDKVQQLADRWQTLSRERYHTSDNNSKPVSKLEPAGSQGSWHNQKKHGDWTPIRFDQ